MPVAPRASRFRVSTWWSASSASAERDARYSTFFARIDPPQALLLDPAVEALAGDPAQLSLQRFTVASTPACNLA